MKSWKVDQDMMSFLQLVGNIAMRQRLESSDSVHTTTAPPKPVPIATGGDGTQDNDMRIIDEIGHTASIRPCYNDCSAKVWAAKSYRTVSDSAKSEPGIHAQNAIVEKDCEGAHAEYSAGQCDDSKRNVLSETGTDFGLLSTSPETLEGALEESSTDTKTETDVETYEPARCYCYDFMPYVPASDIISEQRLAVVSEEEKARQQTKLLARGLGAKSRTVSLLQTPRKDITPLSHTRKVSFVVAPDDKPHDTKAKVDQKRAVKIEGASSSGFGGLFAAIADMSVTTKSDDSVDEEDGSVEELDDSGIEDTSGDGLGGMIDRKDHQDNLKEGMGKDEDRVCLDAESIDREIRTDSRISHSLVDSGDRPGGESTAMQRVSNGTTSGSGMSMEARVEQHIREVQGHKAVPAISFSITDQDGDVQSIFRPSDGRGSQDKVMPSALRQKKGRSVSYSARSTTRSDGGERPSDSELRIAIPVRDDSKDYVNIHLGVVVAPEAKDFNLLESHHKTYDKDRVRDLRKPLQQLMSAMNTIFEAAPGAVVNAMPLTPAVASETVTTDSSAASANHSPARATATVEACPVSFDELLAIAGRIESNCFGYRNRKESVHTQLGRMVVPTASYFNHSCRPNVTAEFADSNLASFVAKRKIYDGQEVCISYIDENLPRSERQFRLKDSYLFHCVCAKCIEPDSQKGNPSWSKSVNAYAKPPSNQPKKNNKAINKATNKKKKGAKKGRQRQDE
ncbi:hypothetical protein SARC_00017 [Sphaeroforma arctica JP610]|uniref:SET domain-containing protein n=1 Tax=Sphaeroforma arctica JP610 TaxID=667725 RepID=A0A0L0GHQ3_9EUKA|nr:hypothetical protein SARC_00017 [Sphaeroforma arctica JP610]KNC87883.1 hypothetical protein SARC_00017 [Sphaeroforma arctica JP610]|eukprot:XP_014161785.1 hypothetical protein SARC_00017 [Sphaeroforma arctica JP610]